jgi:hypothetical protein
MRVKFIALLTALVLVPVLVFAAPVIVTWEWLLEDPMVTTFRYQLDGEDDDNWTVVDAFVTSYTQEGLDGEVTHTLYLQQSYDGINFSESAIAEADPQLLGDLMVYEEEPFEVIEPEVVIAEEVVALPEAEVVAEPVVAVAPAAVATPPAPKAKAKYYTTITVGGTFDYQFSNELAAYLPYNLKAGIGLNFNNIVGLNKAMGVGFSVDAAYSPYMQNSYTWTQAGKDLMKFKFGDIFQNFDHALDVSAAVMLNMHASKVAFDLGVGGFFVWGPEFKAGSGDKWHMGALAKASLAYRFNKTISVGIAGKYGVVLSDMSGKKFEDLPMFAEGSLFMGFSF